MAGSPVLIDSSSPEAFRVPTITPPSRQDLSHRSHSASSLLSPSALLRAKPTGLKSGTNTTDIPEGANSGFATAASLWRLPRHLDESFVVNKEGQGLQKEPDVVERQTGSERGAAKKKTTGKLPKAKKGVDNADLTEKERKCPSKPSKDFGQVAAVGNREPVSRNTEDVYSFNGASPTRKSNAARDLRVDGADSLARADEKGKKPMGNAQSKKVTAKPRKLPSKVTKPAAASDCSKSRKKLAKSASIILNSDDPDEVCTGNFEGMEVSMRGEDVQDTSAVGSDGNAGASRQDQTPEKSAYFVRSKLTAPLLKTKESNEREQHAKAGSVAAGDGDHRAGFAQAKPAFARRRSWTPLFDTKRSPFAGSALSPATLPRSDEQPRKFTDILGGFGYIADDAQRKASMERNNSGEAITKRRRIELSDTASAVQSAGHETQAVAKKATKRAKEPKQLKPKKQPKEPQKKSKVQTITSLATAAYLPAEEPESAPGTVSEFFAPRKQEKIVDYAQATTEADLAKSKKPRKPRSKGNADPQTGKSGKSGKAAASKKSNSKSNTTAVLAPLYSPSRAAAQLPRQDFLFGTSSQIAVDDTPDFIRDIQAALQESEMPAGTQATASPQGKSRINVPTAPHGTSLSLEQSDKDAWSLVARNRNGALVKNPRYIAEALRKRTRAERLAAFPALDVPVTQQTQEKAVEHEFNEVDLTNTSPINGPAADDAGKATTRQPSMVERVMEPLSDTPLRDKHEEPRDDVILSPKQQLPDRKLHPIEPPEVKHNVNADPIAPAEEDTDWFFLRSEDSEIVDWPTARRARLSKTKIPENEPHDSAIVEISDWPLLQDGDVGSPARRTTPAAQSSPPSCVSRSPSPKFAFIPPHRPVLQTLDANANMAMQAPAFGSEVVRQQHAFSTSTKDEESAAKRGRGRPRKAESVTASEKPSPKKRGRPRKLPAADFGPSSPPRKRGRPRKEPATASDAAGKAQRPKTSEKAASASQPAPQEGFLDIDEIADSDTPLTPSPPRRRATSSARSIQPLTLSPSKGPSGGNTVVPNGAKLHPTSAPWPAIANSLFPRITSELKSTARSNDPQYPSWWQKILLYDPIVLEDLTCWLNERGLRISVPRLRAKTKASGPGKGRGRPKSKKGELAKETRAEDAVKDAHEGDEGDMEMAEESLQGWMVQKWCEEGGVCCLWKEGLRRGVRSRY